MEFNLPQHGKLVCGSPIVTTNSAVTGDYISCKNAHKIWIVAYLLQTVSHTTTLGVNEATAVAPTGAVPITEVMPRWKCADIATTDLLVRSTANAATIAATAGTTNQILILEIDPSILSAGFDCIAGTLTASSQSSNYVLLSYYLFGRYHAEQPTPSAITD